MNLEVLKAEFQKLPPQEKLVFRDYAWACTEISEKIDSDVLDAWIRESQKRMQEYRNGDTIFYDSLKVEAALQDKYGLAD